MSFVCKKGKLKKKKKVGSARVTGSYKGRHWGKGAHHVEALADDCGPQIGRRVCLWTGNQWVGMATLQMGLEASK